MTDAMPPVDPASELQTQPARPPTPRWVKLLAVGGLAAVVLVVVVMLVSGGTHGPGMHVPGAGQTPPATIAQGSAAPSGGPASGVGGPAAAAEATRSIAVTTFDTMAYQPASIDVSAGETVTFVVTNGGQAVHEFTLGDAAMQQEHADQMAHMPAGMAHDQRNTLTLQPGETKELTWRFGGDGMLEYACHEPGHYQAGMRGRITVS